MLQTTQALLRILIVLNGVLAVACVLILGVTLFGPPSVIATIGAEYKSDIAILVPALRQVMLLGLASFIAAHFIFRELLAITAGVRAGMPFAAGNARRVRHIAWALLALQSFDLVFGLIAMRVETALGERIDWSFSTTGWLAVFLLFVLARIFEHGAAMQDELEGTV